MCKKTFLFIVCGIVVFIPFANNNEAFRPQTAHALSNDFTFTIGPEELNEPFNCFTDGSFGIYKSGGTIYTLPPVNNVNACEQYVWSGSDIDNLYPLHKMNGITSGSNTFRNHVFDYYGYWPFSLYVDDNGKWYSYMASEDNTQCDTGLTGAGSDLRTISLWTSTDQGQNWQYEGVSVSISDDYALPCNLQPEFPKNAGAGDHKLVVDSNGDYIYILYTNFIFGEKIVGVDNAHGNMAVARAALDENGVPGLFYKYYEGSFSEPGFGGNESWVMSTEGPADQYIDSSQRAVMWNTYLQKYVMVSLVRTNRIMISTSSDLLHWSTPQRLHMDSPNPILYVNLVSLDSEDQTGQQSVWLYYTKVNIQTNSSYEVNRRLLTFNNQTNLAAGAFVRASDYYNDSGEKWGVSYVTDEGIKLGYRSEAESNTIFNPSWVYVDLGSQQTFNQVRLFPDQYGKGFPRDFSIEGSNSSSGPWTVISSYESYPQPRSGETQILNFSAQSYRYVRIHVAKVSATYDFTKPFKLQLMEMQVFNNTQANPPVPATPTSSAVTTTASADFSGTQGSDRWSYMYLADLNLGTEHFWSPMYYDSPTGRWKVTGSTTAFIGYNWQHPDLGPNGVRSVARIWRAPADGTIHVTGIVKKGDTTGGDGVQVKVMKNRTKVWPTTEWQYLAYNDSTGISSDFYLDVKANDKIFFVVHPYVTTAYDKTEWDPTIAYEPIASAYDSVAQFSSTQGSNNWYYESYDGSTFSNLTWDAVDGRWEDGSLSISRDLLHPDASKSAVRTWNAPGAGIAILDALVRKADVTGGDGVRVKVFKNTTQLWPASGWEELEFNDVQGLQVKLTTPVSANDKLRLVVDAHASANYDSTLLESNIKLSN